MMPRADAVHTSGSPPSYGAVPSADPTSPAGAAQPPRRPAALTRAASLSAARALGGAGGLAAWATLHQSSSLRALHRLTSTASTVESVASTPSASVKATLRPSKSARGRGPAKETAPLLRRSLTTSQLPPLVRAMSSVLVLPREPETFRCYVCFDDAVPVSDAVTLASCGHRYCVGCFKSYLEIKIKEGNVYPVCFHPTGDASAPQDDRKTCGVAVDPQQIERLVDAEIWKKLNLYRFNKEHEHARECPHCSHSQECQGPQNPECVCQKCGKAFCFFHDIAHEGGSCADYELENAEAESINRATIKEIAKPCPGCQRDVEKDGGCNHMKCVVCQTSFCWLCGETIEDVPMPSHFTSSSGSACSGKQFDGDEAIEIPWQLRAYAVLVTVLCYPIAFASAAVFTPISWCRRSAASSSEAFSDMFWFNHTVAMIWLALVVSLLFFVLAIVVELTIRLVVFVVMLPFVAIKTVALKAVGCCYGDHTNAAPPPPTPTPTAALTDDATSGERLPSEREVDLEAGRVPNAKH